MDIERVPTAHLARPDVLLVLFGRKIGRILATAPTALQQLQPPDPKMPQPLYNGEDDKIQGYNPNTEGDAAKIQVANLRLHQCVFDQEVPLLDAGERSKNIVTQTAAQRCRALIEQNPDDLYALRKLSSVAPDPELMFNTWILVIASDQLEYILRHGSDHACLTPAACRQ